MKKLILPCLAAIFIVSASAFTEEPSPILGRWELRSGFQGQPYSFLVIFRRNGNYDGFLNNKIFVSGTYRMRKDTLYIADPTCNSNYFGTYKVKFMGRPDSIQFNVVQDTCRGRREGADGFVFKKVPNAN